MPRVAVVTDSTACIPRNLVEQYGIGIVPVTFLFGDTTYIDDPDTDIQEFYHRLRTEKTVPTTSPASPGAYLEAYEKLRCQCEAILCVTVASRVSGMYQAARIAKDMAADTLPDTCIEVLDSETASMAQGFMVLAAARAAAEGKSVREVMAAARAVQSQVELVAVVDTLDYLAKSGRIPKAGAWAGSLVGLKPVLSIKDGRIRLKSASRSMQKAAAGMVKSLGERSDGKGGLRVSVIHADVPDLAEQLQQRVVQKVDCAEILVARFSPVMGLYTGPGVLGLVYYNERRN